MVSLKPGPDGQRRRKKVSGKNKTEVRAKLAELYDELDDGVVTNASYTVAYAIEEWLADGLAGRAPKAVSTQREVLEPLIDIIGAVPLRELSAPTVRSAHDARWAHAGHQARRGQRKSAPQCRHACGHTRGPGRPPVKVAHIRAADRAIDRQRLSIAGEVIPETISRPQFARALHVLPAAQSSTQVLAGY